MLIVENNQARGPWEEVQRDAENLSVDDLICNKETQNDSSTSHGLNAGDQLEEEEGAVEMEEERPRRKIFRSRGTVTSSHDQHSLVNEPICVLELYTLCAFQCEPSAYKSHQRIDKRQQQFVVGEMQLLDNDLIWEYFLWSLWVIAGTIG